MAKRQSVSEVRRHEKYERLIEAAQDFYRRLRLPSPIPAMRLPCAARLKPPKLD